MLTSSPPWTEVLKEIEFNGLFGEDIRVLMWDGGLDTKQIADIFEVHESEVWSKLQEVEGGINGRFGNQGTPRYRGGGLSAAFAARGAEKWL